MNNNKATSGLYYDMKHTDDQLKLKKYYMSIALAKK